MRWVIESLTSFILWLVTGFLNLLGNGVVELITLDVGMSADGKASVFDVVFSSIFTFAEYFQEFAFALLMLNFLWQLVRIITSSEGATETPIALAGRTFVAGIGIFASGTIIRIVESFFSMLYTELLSAGGMGTIKLAIGTEFDDIRQATGAVDSLVGTIVCVFFVFIIGWEFLMFLAEVVERYVILGILYYTSPLAFAMAGSKSTSSIFNSWVRMLLSQMLLMCFNVFFYGLFLRGYTSYGETISKMVSAAGLSSSAPIFTGRTGVIIVWNIMMYAILHIGTRMDAYMATLGLSTAQAGRGLATAMTSSFSSAVRTIGTGAFVGGKMLTPFKSLAGRVTDNYKSTHKAPTKDSKTGGWTADTIADVAKGNSKESTLSGNAVTAPFLRADSDFKDILTSMRVDPGSGSVSKELGGAVMHGRPDANGNALTAKAVPITDSATRDALMKQQAKIGMVDGVEYGLLIEGDQSERAKLLGGGAAMEKANNEWAAQKDGRSVEPILDSAGDFTGGFHYEERDKNGDLVRSFDELPAAMFDGETLPPDARLESWGGQDCYRVDTTKRDNGETGLKEPVPDCDSTRMAAALNSEFSAPSIGGQGGGLDLQSASIDADGIIEGTKADGTRVGLAPASAFQAKEGSNTQIRQAANGAAYVEVPLGQNENGTPISAADVFTPNPTNSKGTPTNGMAPPPKGTKDVAQYVQGQMTSPLEASAAHVIGESGMFTTTTAEHKGADGATVPEQKYAYAPASRYAPVDPTRNGISTVTSKDGESFYRVPLQDGERAHQAFQVASGGPERIEQPDIGHVSPVDSMAIARQNFANGQIDPGMTHCDGLATGGLRMWNQETGAQQIALPVSAYSANVTPDAYMTATSGESYMVFNATKDSQVSDFATQRTQGKDGHYLNAELKQVPTFASSAPVKTSRILQGAEKTKNGKSQK